MNKQTISRLRIAGIVVVLVAIVIIAGIWYITSRPPEEEVIRWGVCGPMTGPAARTGEEMRQASVLAAEEINAKGGILGMKIKLYFGDSESSPEKGVTAVERLITENNVHVIVGNYHSSVGLAIMDTISENHIPFLNTGSMSEAIPQKMLTDPEKYKYCFKLELNSSAAAISEMAFVEDMISKGLFDPKSKTYAVIVEDTDYGRWGAMAFKPVFDANGWTMVTEDIIQPDATDFLPQLQNIKTLDPDILYCSIATDTAAMTVTKQRYEVGITALTFGESFIGFAEFLPICGESANGIISVFQKTDTTDVGKQFMVAFKKRFGTEPGMMSQYQYDGMYIMAQAIERAGSSLDPDKIVSELEKTDYAGCLVFRERFHPVTHEALFGTDARIYPMVQVIDGRTYTIWPPAVSETDLWLPS